MSRVSGTREGTGTPSMADQQAEALEEHQKLRAESANKKRQAGGYTKTGGAMAVTGTKIAAKELAKQGAKEGAKLAVKEGAKVAAKEGGKAVAKGALQGAKAVPYLNIAATAVDITVTAVDVGMQVGAAVEEQKTDEAIASAASGATSLGGQGYEANEARQRGDFSVQGETTIEGQGKTTV